MGHLGRIRDKWLKALQSEQISMQGEIENGVKQIEG